MFRNTSLLSLLVVAGISNLSLHTFAEEPVKELTLHSTPTGVKYGTWGRHDEQPAPTLFILAGTIESTLNSKYFRQCGNDLAEQGYLCVSIDLPCHGEQVSQGISSGLGGWAQRIGNDDNIVAECNERLKEVLDDLVAKKLTDSSRVAICGTSRGGFLAIHFAAFDHRVGCAAAFAPVADLAEINEFQAIKDHPLVEKVSLSSQLERLAGRPVWIVIGDRDTRVSTKSVVEFALKLCDEAVKKDVPSQMELHVISEPRGHSTPKGSSQKAATWIADQLERN